MNMDPLRTPRENLLVNPRQSTTETPSTTTPGTPKTPETPRSTTHRDMKLLSPGIDSSYFLSNPKDSITTERITPPKILSHRLENFMTPNNQIHLKNNQTMIHHQIEHFLKNLIKRRRFLLTKTKKMKRHLMI